MLADNDYPSLVPETSRYTLEELHEVFSQDTRTIVKIGWAQLKWLITGVGDRRRESGRWVRSEYPCLVPRFADREEQELEDRGGLVSGSEAINDAATHTSAGTTSKRPTKARTLEV